MNPVPARLSAPVSTARAIGALAILVLAWALLASQAWAQTFPPLTGRVVDRANILSPAVEQRLTEKFAALEAATTDQVVVVTLDSLQNYEIEEYGYRLGREWGIGQADKDNGVLLIVAPNERKVRIEVGYGLEPVITDALSSVIIQSRILPAFREGRMEAGIEAGADAIVEQLTIDRGVALERAQAAQAQVSAEPDVPVWVIILIVLFLVFFGRGWLPFLFLSSMSGGGRSWGGGGGGGFGGGFSGGGGGFGGGGASGGW